VTLPARAPNKNANRENPVQDWRRAGIEPTIDDMLADPIVHALMRCDRIGEHDVRAAIARALGKPALVLTLGAQATQRPR